MELCVGDVLLLEDTTGKVYQEYVKELIHYPPISPSYFIYHAKCSTLVLELNTDFKIVNAYELGPGSTEVNISIKEIWRRESVDCYRRIWHSKGE